MNPFNSPKPFTPEIEGIPRATNMTSDVINAPAAQSALVLRYLTNLKGLLAEIQYLNDQGKSVNLDTLFASQEKTFATFPPSKLPPFQFILTMPESLKASLGSHTLVMSPSRVIHAASSLPDALRKESELIEAENERRALERRTGTTKGRGEATLTKSHEDAYSSLEQSISRASSALGKMPIRDTQKAANLLSMIPSSTNRSANRFVQTLRANLQQQQTNKTTQHRSSQEPPKTQISNPAWF